MELGSKNVLQSTLSSSITKYYVAKSSTLPREFEESVASQYSTK